MVALVASCCDGCCVLFPGRKALLGVRLCTQEDICKFLLQRREMVDLCSKSLLAFIKVGSSVRDQ